MNWDHLPGFPCRDYWRPGEGSNCARHPSGARTMLVHANDNLSVMAARLGVDFGITYVGVLADRVKAASLKADGKTLCRDCGGTGNILETMHMECPICEGSGVAPDDYYGEKYYSVLRRAVERDQPLAVGVYLAAFKYEMGDLMNAALRVPPNKATEIIAEERRRRRSSS